EREHARSHAAADHLAADGARAPPPGLREPLHGRVHAAGAGRHAGLDALRSAHAPAVRRRPADARPGSAPGRDEHRVQHHQPDLHHPGQRPGRRRRPDDHHRGSPRRRPRQGPLLSGGLSGTEDPRPRHRDPHPSRRAHRGHGPGVRRPGDGGGAHRAARGNRRRGGPDPRELWREALASALAALRARLGAQPDAVITALPPAQASSTFLELPFGETKKIEATLGFEVENILPLDLEEVVYDYQVLARTKGKSELLVGITRGEDLEALLSALAEASLDPRVVTLPALGTFLLGAEACASQLSSAENGLVFVDLGAERTLVAIARGTADKRGRPALAFLRSLETGIGEVAELANPSLEDGSDQAREIQRRLAAAIRPLRQTISAARTRDTRALDGVRLVGEACRIAGIGPWLERQLGLPVEVVDALPGGDGADPAFAQAVGLAVRGLERGRNLLNFR